MKLDALIMAGGRGTRLGAEEKPMLFVGGKPLIEYVFEALKNSERIARIFVAAGSSAEKTRAWAEKHGIEMVLTPGKGYVDDLLLALQKFKLKKTLVVSADLPLLRSEDIGWAADEYLKSRKRAACVLVPLEIFRENKITPTLALGEFVPSGVNFVDGGNLNEKDEAKIISRNFNFALNVNTPEDLKRAEEIIRMER